MAKKEGKRRSVQQQIGEIMRQWEAVLSAEDPYRALEDMIAEYEKLKPGVFNAQFARDALRERLSANRSAEFEQPPSHRRGSGPRGPRK